MKGERTGFVPPFDWIADSAGYIVFKDAKVVIFYTNDIKVAPSLAFLEGFTMAAQMLDYMLAMLNAVSMGRS